MIWLAYREIWRYFTWDWKFENQHGKVGGSAPVHYNGPFSRLTQSLLLEPMAVKIGKGQIIKIWGQRPRNPFPVAKRPQNLCSGAFRFQILLQETYLILLCSQLFKISVSGAFCQCDIFPEINHICQAHLRSWLRSFKIVGSWKLFIFFISRSRGRHSLGF